MANRPVLKLKACFYGFGLRYNSRATHLRESASCKRLVYVEASPVPWQRYTWKWTLLSPSLYVDLNGKNGSKFKFWDLNHHLFGQRWLLLILELLLLSNTWLGREAAWQSGSVVGSISIPDVAHAAKALLTAVLPCNRQSEWVKDGKNKNISL